MTIEILTLKKPDKKTKSSKGQIELELKSENKEVIVIIENTGDNIQKLKNICQVKKIENCLDKKIDLEIENNNVIAIYPENSRKGDTGLSTKQV